ncbi:transcription termination factor MTERF15, mitochondrial-like [Fagus crenata]
MLNFLYKAIHNGSCFTIRARCISSTSNQHSFTVSYLINHFNFETPDKADLVISFFKNNGFSHSQISNIVRRLPPLLLSDPQKTFLPKLEFFMSKGFTSSDIATLVSRNPEILKRSLKNHVIPSFVFFKNLLGTDENTITAIKRFSGILIEKLGTRVVPNINLLRENGVPESNICALLKHSPRVIIKNVVRLKEIVEEVKEMGFDPLKFCFVQAVFAMSGMNKSTRERKVNAYKKWGLSEEEILEAFGKCPYCIMKSEDKIMRVMDFFVNKMGLEASLIVKHPVLLSLSLEKRMIPRVSVIEVLLSKGLVVKKNIYLPTVFMYSENLFLQKFVTPIRRKFLTC